MSGDDDERVRRALQTAHRDEAPPPFDALVARRPRPRASLRAPLVVGGALLAASLVLLVRRPHPPSPPPPIVLSSLHVPSRGPLDFLLEMPGEKMLAETPRFDAKGEWP